MKMLIIIVLLVAVVVLAHALLSHVGIRPSPEITVKVPDVNF